MRCAGGGCLFGQAWRRGGRSCTAVGPSRALAATRGRPSPPGPRRASSRSPALAAEGEGPRPAGTARTVWQAQAPAPPPAAKARPQGEPGRVWPAETLSHRSPLRSGGARSTPPRGEATPRPVRPEHPRGLCPAPPRFPVSRSAPLPPGTAALEATALGQPDSIRPSCSSSSSSSSSSATGEGLRPRCQPAPRLRQRPLARTAQAAGHPLRLGSAGPLAGGWPHAWAPRCRQRWRLPQPAPAPPCRATQAGRLGSRASGRRSGFGRRSIACRSFPAARRSLLRLSAPPTALSRRHLHRSWDARLTAEPQTRPAMPSTRSLRRPARAPVGPAPRRRRGRLARWSARCQLCRQACPRRCP